MMNIKNNTNTKLKIGTIVAKAALIVAKANVNSFSSVWNYQPTFPQNFEKLKRK